MKIILLAIALFGIALVSHSQNIYQIRADSVRIYNVCDTAELILENRTQTVPGYLFNKGRGRTEFRRMRFLNLGNGLISIGDQDTLDFSNSLSGSFIKNQYLLGQTADYWVNGRGRVDKDFYLGGGMLLNSFKNNVAGDSVLTTDVNGYLKMKAVAAGAGFIQNQYSAAQGANYWIRGAGRVDSLLTLSKYKNNATEDSVLTTDISGRVKLKTGGSFITASNGLKKLGTDIQLGANFTDNINMNGLGLNFYVGSIAANNAVGRLILTPGMSSLFAYSEGSSPLAAALEVSGRTIKAYINPYSNPGLPGGFSLDTGAYRVYVGTAGYMIYRNGKLGVNKTSIYDYTNYNLDVNGTARATGQVNFSMYKNNAAGDSVLTTDVNGNLKFKVASGGSAGTSSPIAILKDFYSPVAITATTPQIEDTIYYAPMYTYNLSANRLANNGEKIKFAFGGSFADTQNQKHLSISIGSTSITGFGGEDKWDFSCWMIRTGNTTAIISVIFHSSSTNIFQQKDLVGLDFSQPILVAVNGGSASGDAGSIIAKMGTISWEAAAQ